VLSLNTIGPVAIGRRPRLGRGRPPISREIRVGAVVDYLVGVPLKVIAPKWGISQSLVVYWAKRAGFLPRGRGYTLKKME
jgi:hypothetical protein